MEKIQISGTNGNSDDKWTPYLGVETDGVVRYNGFVDDLNNISEAGEKVIDETFRIMERCGDPALPQNYDTGLVIGYVQSGKTLSFTTLTALARDNHYQLIIIIAGTSTPLSTQSWERMVKDLRYDSRYDRKWLIYKNASSTEQKKAIQLKLEQWADLTVPRDECSTVLLTVMKNGNHLKNLAKMLKGMELKNVPTLIIDDESDQASLNTRASANASEGKPVNEGDVSTIYVRINELRDIFPHHTFLQYTATPQANLFINILDRLSPNFIKLLTPGQGYTGGSTFFLEHPELVRPIPASQIPSNQVTLSEPPESLLYALRIFFLGVVAGKRKNDQRNRSMMVHPSRLTDSQAMYLRWIQNICKSWQRILSENDTEDKIELIADFVQPYEDLKATVGESLPSFEELTGTSLLHEIKQTMILELNARGKKTPTVTWRDFYAHILVGGQAMDRGFTVEGLTVTYMPRSLGTGQVDTTLQRARFFGYKGKYLGFCRVWLDQPTISAFRQIIEHEEDVRRSLMEFDLDNKHLNNWSRKAVLHRMLRVTRPNIIYNAFTRSYFGAEWLIIKAPQDTFPLINDNNEIIQEFISAKQQLFHVDAGGNNRTEEQRHLHATIPLSECLDKLLNDLRFTLESDSQDFSTARYLMAKYSDLHPEESCEVYLMSGYLNDGQVNQRTRTRRMSKNGKTIRELFQGPNAPTSYPGDREIRNRERVSIQLHKLHMTDENGQELFDAQGNPRYPEVMTLAIWIPQDVGRDVIRQDDNHE